MNSNGAFIYTSLINMENDANNTHSTCPSGGTATDK